MTDNAATAELPSTSGRARMTLGVTAAPEGHALVCVYQTALYGRSIDPITYTLELPAVPVSADVLAGLAAAVRGYADTMTSTAAQGPGVTRELSVEPRLTFAFAPGHAEAIVAGWQAVFSFAVVAGGNLTLGGHFVVDATCLDLFAERLEALLEGVAGGGRPSS